VFWLNNILVSTTTQRDGSYKKNNMKIGTFFWKCAQLHTFGGDNNKSKLHSKRNLQHIKCNEFLLPFKSKYFIFPYILYEYGKIKKAQLGDFMGWNLPVTLTAVERLEVPDSRVLCIIVYLDFERGSKDIKIDLIRLGRENVNWSHVAHDRDQRWALWTQ